MSAGYTYTTISSDPGEPGRIDVSFHLDSRAWIAVCGQDDDRPQLTVSLGEVSVRICPALGPATAEDARIARDLAARRRSTPLRSSSSPRPTAPVPRAA